jgi:VanZ family protein
MFNTHALASVLLDFRPTLYVFVAMFILLMTAPVLIMSRSDTFASGRTKIYDLLEYVRAERSAIVATLQS